MTDALRVKFIAHAGFCLQHGSTTVMVDPWFYSSNFKNAVLHGVGPGERTIDFQIPNCRDKVEDFRPDAIVVSHFHTHHSPLREIREFIGKRDQVVLGFPAGAPTLIDALGEKLGEVRSRAVYRPLRDGESFEIGSFTVTGYSHPVRDHLGYLFRCPAGSVFHLADSIVNRNRQSRELDPMWQRLKDVRPDLMFLSAGGNCNRRVNEKDGTRSLQENSIVSPFEAARLTALLRPKLASVIGIYNQSIWKNRSEFGLPAAVVEQAFHWGLQHLDPEIAFVAMTPGYLFEVADGKVSCSPGPTMKL